MNYRCPKCGEELIGAVNRCWKCGRGFVVPVTEQVAASAAAANAEASEPQPVAAEAIYIAQFAESTTPPPEAGPIRVGSPFAGPVRSNDAPVVQPAPPARPNYPQNAAAAGGAYAANFLAVMSLIVCLIAGDGVMLAVAALLIAFLGLIMGAWGLSSNQRKAAGIGLLLCVLAVGLSSVWTGLNAYREQRAGQLGERAPDGF